MRVSSGRSYTLKNLSPEVTRIQCAFTTADVNAPTQDPDTGVFVSSVTRTGVGVFDVTFKGPWAKTLSFGVNTTDPDLPATVTAIDKATGVVEVTVHDRHATAITATESTGNAVSLTLDVSDTSLPT